MRYTARSAQKTGCSAYPDAGTLYVARELWQQAWNLCGSRQANEFIGQQIDYSEQKLNTVRMLTIDSLNLSRLDLIKIDVERMELEVL